MSEKSEKQSAQYEMGQNQPPLPPDAPDGKGEKKPGRPPLEMEKVISPEHLKMLSSASGGFSFRPDPALEQEFRQTGVLKSGYTNLNTKTIYYNPIHATGAPEFGVEPWQPAEAKGFFYHEAFHHAPEVTELQDRLLGNLKHVPIPEAYRGDANAEQRFLGAVHGNVNNAVADVWLESFAGRRPYTIIRNAVRALNTEDKPPETYKNYSKPQQLLQSILRHRFNEDPEVGKKLDDDVYKSFRRIIDSRALSTTMDWQAYTYFAKEGEQKRSLERKMQAYEQVWLPEYLKLMTAELEKRKEERQKQKGEGQKGKGGKPGKPGRDTSDVPLTKAEIEELKNQLLKELEEAAKEYASQAPSKEDGEKFGEAMKELEGILGKEGPKVPVAPPKDDRGADALAARAEALRDLDRARRQRGLAEGMQVRQESIESWERTKEKYPSEIMSTAAVLAEIFLDDRRKKIEYLKREGEIVPGLEYEHVAAILTGELDPDTKMRLVRNPQFLQTQLELLYDTSESMFGEKIEKSTDMGVIIVESFKLVLKDLEAENLLIPDEEQPFQVGVTKYSTAAERVSKLEERLSDEKEIKIVDRLSQVGGGTDEVAAVKQVHEALALNKDNVIKIIIMFTDGQGNREGIAPVMQQIEEDGQVIFLIIGYGDDQEEAEAVTASYIEPLKDKNKNIFAFSTDKPATALPYALGFLRKEIDKRRQI